jgi:adenylate kinase
LKRPSFAFVGRGKAANPQTAQDRNAPQPTRSNRLRPVLGRTEWIALTGTPGTGKSSVARLLPVGSHAVELAALAVKLGAARRLKAKSMEVDLPAFRRAFRVFARSNPKGVVVGHLAHFLPVSYVIVLRCWPVELADRLRKAHRRAAGRNANVLAEALDVVLVEALGSGVPVYEVDTTRLSISDVARRVASIIRRRPPARYGRVNWLSDRRGTEQLLRDAL